MATQYEVLAAKLNEVLENQERIFKLLEKGGEISFDQEVDPGEFREFRKAYLEQVPSEGDDPKPRPKQMTRHEVEVRGFYGEPIMVQWSEIDPRIVKAVELSVKNGKDYELYEDQSGTVRISVDAEIAHMMRKAETYQRPVPKVGDRELDALGTEE